jgi:hypothetical protein
VSNASDCTPTKQDQTIDLSGCNCDANFTTPTPTPTPLDVCFGSRKNLIVEEVNARQELANCLETNDIDKATLFKLKRQSQFWLSQFQDCIANPPSVPTKRDTPDTELLLESCNKDAARYEDKINQLGSKIDSCGSSHDQNIDALTILEGNIQAFKDYYNECMGL